MIHSFDPFPFLITEHYFLRPLLQDDADAIFALRSSDIVNRYLARKKAETLEEAQNYIDLIRHKVSTNETIYWVITRANDKHLIGTICLWNLDEATSSAEIGYEILPEFHGKGIMKEVLPVVIEYGFKEMKLHSIIAIFHRENLGSLKLLQRYGFMPESAEGLYEDEIMYRLNHEATKNSKVLED